MRNITRRHTRIKRDADLSQILFGQIDPDGMTHRAKRDTLDHVESVMKDVQGKIYNLKSNASFIEEPPNLATNIISETSAGCVIMDKGQVNCSTVIYHDRKTWRQSRHQIDNEIYQLKQKLEKLKEIRRHLKHTKPIQDPADEVEDGYKNKTGRLESPDLNDLNVRLEQELGMSTEQYHVNVTKTKKKRKRLHDGDSPRVVKRPRLRPELDIADEVDRLEMTTNGPFVSHSNHHRHNHRYPGTTEGEFSTVGPSTPRRRTTTQVTAATTTTPTTTVSTTVAATTTTKVS